MSKLTTDASVSGTELSGAQLKAELMGLHAALHTAGLQEGNRTTITSDTTLTVNQCGLLLVDCTGGNVALTLPTSGTKTDDAVYNIARLDSTVNTLTVSRGGSDTIEGSSSSVSIEGRGILGVQMPAGGNDWKVSNRSGGTQTGARNALGLGAGADIASAATLDLSEGPRVRRVTGTVTTTAFTMDDSGPVLATADDAWPINVSGVLVYTCSAEDSVLLWQDGDGVQHAQVITADLQPPFPVSQAKGGTGTTQATRQIAQFVESFSGNLATGGSVIIPWDNSAPQSNEGNQYYSVSITPKSASSTLEVEALLCISANSSTAQLTGAIFLDSETYARAANAVYMAATNQPCIVPVRYSMTSGSTSAKTFKLRGGNSVASTVTINGSNGSRKLGGVQVSGLKVTEYLP